MLLWNGIIATRPVHPSSWTVHIGIMIRDMHGIGQFNAQSHNVRSRGTFPPTHLIRTPGLDGQWTTSNAVRTDTARKDKGVRDGQLTDIFILIIGIVRVKEFIIETGGHTGKVDGTLKQQPIATVTPGGWEPRSGFATNIERNFPNRLVQPRRGGVSECVFVLWC